MICEHCGSALADSATSCDYCGHAITSQTNADSVQTSATSTQTESFQASPESTQSGSWQADTLPQQVAPVQETKPENILTGIVGALIGAAIGAGVIILLGQLGYVASLSGLILAVCTLKGYELLGHRLSTKGAIICVILIVVTPYFADRLDWALRFQKEMEAEGMSASLGFYFDCIPDLVAMDSEFRAEYIKSLVMIYLFAALGAFGTLRDLFKK